MKNFLLLFFLFLILIDTIVPQAVAPVQGDVVFNTIDPNYGGNNSEFFVIVNRTNKLIDLNGYEVQTFDADGVLEYAGIQWNSTSLLPAYSFRLIASPVEYIVKVNNVTPDERTTFSINGDWPSVGYIALRKIIHLDSLDYIDVVKNAPDDGSLGSYTGVPPNSGLSLSAEIAPVGGSLDALASTRGGISGNLLSLRYGGYGSNLASDFQTADQSIIPIQNSSSAQLPVELSSFSAVVLKTGIKLNWQTETEVNNYGFEVERTSNVKGQTSEVWEKIGFVNGSGNSNSPKNYSYQDMNVTSGKYSYRLKQIDSDGKYEYSKAIEVNLNGPGKFELSQNYPNPFNPTTTIRFSIPEAGNVKLTLYNILAQEIKVLVNETKGAGVHTVNFNASELNSGLYIYKLEANGLTQTRKMTLVK